MTERAHVLIADRCEETRTRLGRALASHLSPVAVSETAGATDCLALLAGARWDALVLGDRLSDASGLEVLDRLRGAGIDLPILLLALPGDQALAAEASRRGATDVAFRSDHLEQVIADTVARAISLHRQRAHAESACRHQQEIERILQMAPVLWHGLNNLLFTIEGSVRLLLAAGCGAEATHRTHLERIQRACERMHAVIGQFHDAALPVLQALGRESVTLNLPDHVPSVGDQR